ncbi:MAG: hypothetical protein EBU04_10555 [Verrucomicrobia bacterium]|nr:hypothetical protein [Verrucomicrobiota bacterium]
MEHDVGREFLDFGSGSGITGDSPFPDGFGLALRTTDVGEVVESVVRGAAARGREIIMPLIETRDEASKGVGAFTG